MWATCFMWPMALLLMVSWFSVLAVSIPVAYDRTTNVALNKPVVADARYAQALVDGNFKSTIRPNSRTLPYILVNLEAVYNLTVIDLFAQNQYNLPLGHNIPFSVYVLEKLASKCDLLRLDTWKKLKGGLQFTSNGEQIEVAGPCLAQYIIVMPDVASELDVQEGLTMGELKAYGTKIRDAPTPVPEPEDEPEVATEEMKLHKGTRKALLQGVDTYSIRPGYGEFVLSTKYDDIPVGWFERRINSMVVTRGEGRVFLITGSDSGERLCYYYDSDTMRQNVERWLVPGNQKKKISRVSSNTPEDGDILFIKREDTFDFAAIAERIRSGKNSAIIGYEGELEERTDDTTELMKALEIEYSRHNVKHSRKLLVGAAQVESAGHLPFAYHFRMTPINWSIFKMKDYFRNIPQSTIDTPEMQTVIKRIIEKYAHYFADKAICSESPYIKTPETYVIMSNYNDLMLSQRGDKIYTLPGFAKTPGDVLSTETPTKYTVTLKPKIGGSFFPLGGYAKAGEGVRYKVLKTNRQDLKDWYIRIGHQTDFLGKLNTIKRWMNADLELPLKREGEISSPMGGVVMIKLTDNAEITIQVENIYRHAWFDIQDPKSKENWEQERQKHRGIPYMAITGQNMITVTLTSALLSMTPEDIYFVTMYFDNGIKMMHNYRGTDWSKHHMEAFFTDHQISHGWGHAGYPFMGHDQWGVCFADADGNKRGEYRGVPHELGHNLQVRAMTLVNGGEVTNNMYIPVMYKYLLNLTAFDYGHSPGLGNPDTALADLWKGSAYTGVGVNYYNYMEHQFTEGLVGNVVQNALREEKHLRDNNKKADFWVKHMCLESKRDLVPLHRLWHFPISQDTVNACAAFPCFMPDDQQTSLAPEAVERELKAYGKDCSREKPEAVKLRTDLFRGLYQPGEQFIFFGPAE